MTESSLSGPQATGLAPSKPVSDRRLANVVGREVETRTLLSALHPYMDYAEVRAEMDRIDQDRKRGHGRQDKMTPINADDLFTQRPERVA